MKPTATPYPGTWTNSAKRLRAVFACLSKTNPALQGRVGARLLTSLTAEDHEDFAGDFSTFAHPHQLAPALANSGADWTTWLLIGGRGAGKTRAGAEWVRALALRERTARIALIGENEHEARAVMVEGVSGVLAAHRRRERPHWMPTRRLLQWRNGAVAQVFSAEEPDSLRGPQFSAAWLDELAKWRHAEAVFDMLQFGLRLGVRPRQVIT